MIADTRNNASLSLIGIYEISKILSSSLHLEKTLYDVLNLLSSYLQMRRGMIGLVGEKNHLDLVAASGMTHQSVKTDGSRFARGVAGRVQATGMPVVIPNVADDPEMAESDMVGDALDDEVVSLLGVPIKGAGKTVGVLTAERVFQGGTNYANFEADIRFLTMVANLIGQTVLMHQNVAMEREQLLIEKHRLQKALVQKGGDKSGPSVTIENVVGRSKRMQDVYGEIHQIAPSRSTVLLRGESGTGKELIARAIHYLSTRRDKPFIKLNCAALPETLLESELFGHEKGAFTGATQERKGRFESAHTGTLFLDEIGEISASFQAKLLRVLQEGEFERVGGNKTIKVDIRLVCATNKNLEEAVTKGEFRADLYYRINVVPVFVPPLRDRREDIPLLAEHFMKRFNEENERQMGLSGEALRVLSSCYFPGNVRELENCVNRVATMTRGEVVRDVDMPCQRNQCLSSQLWKHSENTPSFASSGEFGQSRPDYGPGPQRPAPPQSMPGPAPDDQAGYDDDAFDEDCGLDFNDDGMTQRDRLLRAMETAGWVQAKAARLLGLTPRQIGYALKKYNIEVKRI